MRILGIETSCDDTAAALVAAKAGRFRVIKNVIISQAKLHNKYGGVVPELAARNHLKNILTAVGEVLNSPSFNKEGARGWSRAKPDIDAIAVTAGPGLATSLHVGVETAKTLAYAWGVPLVGANHMEGHILSVLLDSSHTITYPAVALIVSGGHTELVRMPKPGIYKLIGKTRDDAAGEAFDKSAFMLGLPYPGGPAISKAAQSGDPESFDIPRPMIERDDCEFSFSGMKNAIRLIVESYNHNSPSLPRRGQGGGSRLPVNDLAASIQQAIVDILVSKSLIAAAKAKPKTFILAGGVAANTALREQLAAALPKSVKLLTSSLGYSQDNAAMIAVAAYQAIKKKKFDSLESLSANAHWELV